MAEASKISWTKSTFNPWIGCTRVGPGCDHCYAERQDSRGIYGDKRVHWGAGVPRYRTAEATWAAVRKWNAKAPETEFAGVKGYWPVFMASLADVFDNEVPDEWRADAFKVIRECPNLTFLIVTKRIGNAARMLPADWGDGYPNVVLIATIVNQDEADRDLPKLLATPARARGLSMEPLLGPVDLTGEYLTAKLGAYPFKGLPSEHRTRLVDLLDLVIVGGESGPKARPMHPDWARSLRDQCAAAGVAFHFKQQGAWSDALVADGTSAAWVAADGRGSVDADSEEAVDLFEQAIEGRTGTRWRLMERIGVDAAGRLLDGRTHDGLPPIVPRETPETTA